MYSDVYFLVAFEGHVEPVYFWECDGWWHESSCILSGYEWTREMVTEYVKEYYGEPDLDNALNYAFSMYKDGWFYEIECYQCEPYLPNRITLLRPLSETECLDWMLNHENYLNDPYDEEREETV